MNYLDLDGWVKFRVAGTRSLGISKEHCRSWVGRREALCQGEEVPTVV